MIAEERAPLLPYPPAPPERGLPRFAPSLYAVAVFALMSSIFIIALAPRADTDFWWHLKVGQFIATHRLVPSRDFMSYTFVGHPWTDHEWLSELMLYGLYRLGGLWAQIAVFAAVITAAFGLVYLRMLRLGTNRILALFVLALAFFASTASWGVRIQMLSLLFVSGYALLLDRFRATRDRRYLVVLPMLMVLWTNLHGGFVVGLVVLGITFVGEILNTRTHREGALEGDDLKALGICLLATFAVTILNPNGVRQLLYPLTFVLPNAFTNQIEESASPNFHMPVMMVFEGMLLLLLIAIFTRRPKLDWTQLLLILAFTHLAFSQVRNVPLWCVLIAPFIGVYFQGGKLPRSRRQLKGKLVPVVNLFFLGMVLAVYGAMVYKYINPAALAQSQRDAFPTGAVAYMKTHRLPPHVYCSYSWGGYVLWNLYPQYRDFMDSRADTLYTAAMLQNYNSIYDAAPNWGALLKRYRVEDVLVEPYAPIAQLLAVTPGWHRVYHDKRSVLYTRG